jgi:beta-glucosidase
MKTCKGAQRGGEPRCDSLRAEDLVARVARPVRELKAFQRVRLKPGEKQSVSFTISEKDLAFYSEEMRPVTEAGEFHVWIAPDSVSGVQGSFHLLD